MPYGHMPHLLVGKSGQLHCGAARVGCAEREAAVVVLEPCRAIWSSRCVLGASARQHSCIRSPSRPIAQHALSCITDERLEAASVWRRGVGCCHDTTLRCSSAQGSPEGDMKRRPRIGIYVHHTTRRAGGLLSLATDSSKPHEDVCPGARANSIRHSKHTPGHQSQHPLHTLSAAQSQTRSELCRLAPQGAHRLCQASGWAPP